MKLLKILPIVALLLLAVSTLSAQNNLADANDSACWQSLDALHECAQVQHDRALSQAERCTSYPEYQCQPESEQPQMVHVARVKKQKAKDANAAAVQSRPTQGNNSGSEAVVVEMGSAN
jgi:hypothetical protein